MTKLPVLKVKELIKVLKKLGFSEHHRVGSHAQFKHSGGKRITIPIHSGKDVRKGTLKSILNDLEISTKEFNKLRKKK